VTARQPAAPDYFDHGCIAVAVAGLEDLLEACNLLGLLSLEGTVDAWADIGRLSRMSRDFACDPRDALATINALARRLRGALGHRMAA